MQVRAIYDHGEMKLLEDIQLKSERFYVVVDLPDAEVVMKVEKSKKESDVRSRIDHILGKYAKPLSSGNGMGAKEVWHEHLEWKHMK